MKLGKTEYVLRFVLWSINKMISNIIFTCSIATYQTMNKMSNPFDEIKQRDKTQQNEPKIEENVHFLHNNIQRQNTFDRISMIRCQFTKSKIA